MGARRESVMDWLVFGLTMRSLMGASGDVWIGRLWMGVGGRGTRKRMKRKKVRIGWK